jgi:transposase-like protein
MEYDVMVFEECPRCKQFESDHNFLNCGFTMTKLDDGTVKQEFECSRCGFKWERKYENRSDNGSTFRREAGQSKLF